jgi:hypothetical protein
VLNFLDGVKCDAPLSSKIISVQKSANDNIVNKSCLFARRIASASWTWQGEQCGLASFEKGSDQSWPNLVADLVDNLDHGGQFDPLPFLPASVQKLLSDPQRLFSFAGQGPGARPQFSAGRREEYVKLVVARLRNGQLGLY